MLAENVMKVGGREHTVKQKKVQLIKEQGKLFY